MDLKRLFFHGLKFQIFSLGFSTVAAADESWESRTKPSRFFFGKKESLYLWQNSARGGVPELCSSSMCREILLLDLLTYRPRPIPPLLAGFPPGFLAWPVFSRLLCKAKKFEGGKKISFFWIELKLKFFWRYEKAGGFNREGEKVNLSLESWKNRILERYLMFGREGGRNGIFW